MCLEKWIFNIFYKLFGIMDYSDYSDDYYSDEEVNTNSCYYCGNKESRQLIQCWDSGCEQYFCNNTSPRQLESHIFMHLSIRSHNTIQFPENFEILCFACQELNSFLLCYNLDEEGITVVCRNCIANKSEFRELSWTGIYFERAVDSKLIPSHNSSKTLTTEDIYNLENELKHGEIRNPLDVGPDKYNKISLKYSRFEDYKSTYEKLLQLENEYDKYYSEIEAAQQITPVWDILYKSFTFEIIEERCHFNKKDQVCVIAEDFKATAEIENISQGVITVVLLKNKFGREDMGRVTVKPVHTDVAFERMMRGLKMFNKVDDSFKNIILGYKVEIHNFPDPDIEDFSVVGLPSLNESQNFAVKKALKSKISLIQGPPGTGKTVTTASIVYHLSRLLNKPKQYELTMAKVDEYEEKVDNLCQEIFAINNEKCLRQALQRSCLQKLENDPAYKIVEAKLNDYIAEMEEVLVIKNQINENDLKCLGEYTYKLSTLSTDTSKKLILVCAPSNVAVDHLVEKISQTGLKVVRFFSKKLEEIKSNISHLSYHNIFISHLQKLQNSELNMLFRLKKEGNLDKSQRAKFIKLEMEVRDQILKEFEVVCCTCIGSLDPRLAGLKFDKVVIDEACQAQEPETLLPLLSQPDQIILVGDHFQLGPIIKCKEAEKAGLENSLFRRLIDLGFESYMLSIQYRMHPSISAFPSFAFYEERLENGITKEDRKDYDSEFLWPAPVPIFFYHIEANEEHSSSGKSYVNREEAKSILKIVGQLGKNAEIGIITFYDAQRKTISNYMRDLEEKGFRNIEIASVDSFQGREKDYIILSCVRSNIRAGVGFLGNYRRLNVAITRAKYGLIICGNALTLVKSPVWSRLLSFYQQNSLIYTGKFEELTPFYLQISHTSQFLFEQGFKYAESIGNN